ncbi:MAG: hypothetical protein IKJ37_01635 [Kiritimatiellae bacterium]|nr:hypothetical protein [Kiritimatiellia bacterium]
MKSIVQIRAVAAFAFAVFAHHLMAGYDAAGGYVTLLSHNLGSQGESTFMTNIVRDSYGWSDGLDPHPGTNYYCGANRQLCSPKVTDGTFTFPGDSLTIDHRLIVLATSTLNVADLRLEKGGYIMTYNDKAYSVTLQGNLAMLGSESSPSGFHLGEAPQWYKVEAALKGSSSSFAYSELGAWSTFESFATQYVELDDADEYYGTFEVRTNTCLRLASCLPGRVAVANGGSLAPIGSVEIGKLDLAEGATIDLSHGGTIVVSEAFSAKGKISVSGSSAYPTAVMTVPAGKGSLESLAGISAKGVRLSVSVADGVQTLYAESLEPNIFDDTTGFVTQVVGGVANASLKNIFDEPTAWSDGKVPHSDTNYYGRKGIYITTNSVFGGRSLTIEKANFRVACKNVTIPDLRVKGGTSATSSIFTSAGGAGTYCIDGGMTVLSLLTERWPFAFLGGGNGQTWISRQKIMGDNTRAFGLRGHTNHAPGAVTNYTEFLGDLSEYFGTIIVGTNFTARLGGSSMPGTIRLDTAYSRVVTMAPDGANVSVGKLVSLTSASFAVAETNTLSVTDGLSIAGTLTKNGAGLFSAGGVASPGVDAALNIAEGGLRADSAYALDGVSIMFADGAKYVCDCAVDDAKIIQYGMYDTAAVTAAGALTVKLENLPVEGVQREVALFTVPTSCADALAPSVRFATRPKGYVVEAVSVPTDKDGMSTVKAVFKQIGFNIVIR